jgi:uncharacterized membrane protein YfcA
METQETNSQTPSKKVKKNTGRVLAGAVLLIVGSALMAKQIGADLPHWLFSWPMIVIAVGVFIGAKDRFRDWGWLIPVTVGVVFLLAHNVEGVSFRQFWPLIIIAVGISMILNSVNKKRRKDCW